MGEAAAFEFVLVRNAEPTLVEAGGDHDRARGVALAVRGLDGPRAIAGKLDDLAEADFDAGDDGIIGQLRRHLGAGEDFVEVVQFIQIDQHTARGELVEAQAL